MNFITENNRIYMMDKNEKTIAEITFPSIGNQIVDINKTVVDSTLKGQGVANLLMLAVIEKASNENLKIQPTCSYAVKWFEKNSQYSHLLSSIGDETHSI